MATAEAQFLAGTSYRSDDECIAVLNALRHASTTGGGENPLWAAATNATRHDDNFSSATIRVSGAGLDQRALAAAVRRLAIGATTATLVSGLNNLLNPAAAGSAAALGVAVSNVVSLLAEHVRVAAVHNGVVILEADWKTPAPPTNVAPPAPLPEHARLAREIREMSGLAASALGTAFGVSREQYSRWISGNAISAARHGQLQFLHTLLRDLVRKVGPQDAQIWLRTPVEDRGAPADLLKARKFEQLYRRIVAIPDPMPIENGTVVALSVAEDPLDDEDFDSDDSDEPWSPYDLDSKDR